MVKKSRKDFTYIGEYPFDYEGAGYTIRVLIDAQEILGLQAQKARTSNFKHHRQSYGPFKVTVKVREDPKQ
jgi:hypothetical protein